MKSMGRWEEGEMGEGDMGRWGDCEGRREG